MTEAALSQDGVAELRRYCETLGAFFGAGVSLYRFLLDHGQGWVGQALPVPFERGYPRECFHNALALLLDHPELIYCEGLACVEPVPFPVHHAWCVDPDGRVIEPTWQRPETAHYFGVAFDPAYVLDTAVRTGYCGLLDNLDNDGIYTADPAEWRWRDSKQTGG